MDSGQLLTSKELAFRSGGSRDIRSSERGRKCLPDIIGCFFSGTVKMKRFGLMPTRLWTQWETC